MIEVRDSKGKWIDSGVFRVEAKRFLKYGYYTDSPINSPDWVSYWREQLRRCVEGFEVEDGFGVIHKITGTHYAYLNFGQILRVSGDIRAGLSTGSNVVRKEVSFPDFWDGDYDFFWAIEIARNGLYSEMSQVPSTEAEREVYFGYRAKMYELLRSGGSKDDEEYKRLKGLCDGLSSVILDRLGLYCRPHLDYVDGGNHFVIGKSRRKGFSYKGGMIVANVYNTLRQSLSAIGSYDKKFNEQTMSKVLDYLNFFNEHTGFAKNRLIDKRDFVKSGYVEYIGGDKVEKGYKSVIDASRTFMDNADAMRGLDMYLCLLEEAGAFDNLLEVIPAIRPALTAGTGISGQIILGGTSGDIGGGTAGYMEVFYNPISHGFMPFYNSWEEGNEETLCGYFFPVHLNLEGFYDAQGNSDLEGAKRWEEERRRKIVEGSSGSSVLYQHIQEYPLCPADAFNVTTFSIFPVEELRNRMNRLLSEKIHLKQGIPVVLSYDGDNMNRVIAKPDLTGKLEPIWGYKNKGVDTTGAVVIYEFPRPEGGRGLYKIGYDPYAHDMGTSMASIIVFKGSMAGEKTKMKVVAEYYGRPKNADMVNEIALKLAILYNTQVMVENNINHPILYFEKKHRLNYLCEQPDNVLKASLVSSKVRRKYGCHIPEKLKEDYEKYVNNWLMEGFYDDFGNLHSTIEEIDSLGLLEELLIYNRKGNFDRISALFMCMIQLEEDEILNKKVTHRSRTDLVLDFLKRDIYGK